MGVDYLCFLLIALIYIYREREVEKDKYIKRENIYIYREREVEKDKYIKRENIYIYI